MTTDEAFLADIEQYPRDPVPRLIYADWLEERGRALGPVLRNECAAAEKMGWRKVFSVLDVQKAFGLIYTEEELQRLSTMSFHLQTLRECRYSHLLFPGHSLPLDTFLERTAAWAHRREPDNANLLRQSVELRWHLVRHCIIREARDPSLDDMCEILEEDEQLPTGYELLTVVFLYRARMGNRLTLPFENTFVLCADTTNCGYPVYVGNFMCNSDCSSSFCVIDSISVDEVLRALVDLAPARKPEIISV